MLSKEYPNFFESMLMSLADIVEPHHHHVHSPEQPAPLSRLPGDDESLKHQDVGFI